MRLNPAVNSNGCYANGVGITKPAFPLNVTNEETIDNLIIIATWLKYWFNYNADFGANVSAVGIGGNSIRQKQHFRPTTKSIY